MAEMTPDRLAELRRIASAATPGPWSMHSEPEFSGPWSVGADHLRTDSTVATAWAIEWSAEAAQANAQHIAAFDPTTCLALLDRIEELEADNNKLERENGELYRRIERLEAKLARQRVVLRRLQVAVERRNSQERIEALRRKLSDDKRLLDRIEALESMLLRLYQDTVAPDTHYCQRCGINGGHDESCAMAELEELLEIEVEGNGEEEGGATDA